MADANPVNILAQGLGQFAQSVRELSAHVRTLDAGSAVAAFYAEAKRYMRAFDEQRGLRYRPAIITLAADIVGAGTASSASNDFRVASNEDFLVHEVRTFVGLNDLASEPGGAGLTNPLTTTLTPTEIIALKAANCRFTLLNKDSKVPVTENLSPSLASLCPEAGGQAMRFGPDAVPAFIIPHNVTLQAQFALQSANLIFNTANTTYGVMMTGVYLSREVR